MALQTPTVRPILGIRAARGWFPDKTRTPQDEVRGGNLTAEQAARHGDVTLHIGRSWETESAPAMAVAAGRAALTASGVPTDGIGLLAYAWTNYQGNPFFTAAHCVAEGLGLPRSCTPVGIQQACNGAAMSFSLAAGQLCLDGRTHALIVAADRFTAPAVDHWRSHVMLAYGDGAAAAVVGTPDPGDAFHLLAIEHTAAPELWRTRDDYDGFGPHQAPVPYLNAMPTEKFSDEGGRPRLRAVSHECITDAVDKALASARLAPGDPRIVKVLAPRLSDKVRELMIGPIEEKYSDRIECRYSETGHLGAGDFLANLADAEAAHDMAPGDIMLVLGAGGGYSYTCAVLQVPEERAA
ncbi:3-oxoacyl-[acyl-carrier-protein] synthase III C-terminal domain-containing protein [Streptomyces fractus]|uniref:3-oxoacyl-[acyl-carrier-protein] synthase III C-terminal domain-containing protein n=1 Tax=Streptomyces fractus TaxID=641806 RepID=UPI003CEAD09F